VPPGRLRWEPVGELWAFDESGPSEWTLDSLAAVARAEGIEGGRSQVRRILLAEGMRRRRTRSWTRSKDPDFIPKGMCSLSLFGIACLGRSRPTPTWTASRWPRKHRQTGVSFTVHRVLGSVPEAGGRFAALRQISEGKSRRTIDDANWRVGRQVEDPVLRALAGED
jgi:hypothetical protein